MWHSLADGAKESWPSGDPAMVMVQVGGSRITVGGKFG